MVIFRISIQVHSTLHMNLQNILFECQKIQIYFFKVIANWNIVSFHQIGI